MGQDFLYRQYTMEIGQDFTNWLKIKKLPSPEENPHIPAFYWQALYRY